MRIKSALLIMFIAILAAVILLPNEIKPNEAAPMQNGSDSQETNGKAGAGAALVDITIEKDAQAAAPSQITISDITVLKSSAPSPSPVSSPSAAADTATIIFTFDDGYISDYELAYPILKKYGIRGTSYIIPKYQDNGTPYALTWDMVKEMNQYGWAFGCHTYAHSDLTKMTADEIKTSMMKVNESFQAQGLDPPKIHAFPFGFYDQNAINAMKPFRIQMRKAFYETKFVDPKTANAYEIDSCSADMRTEKRLKEHEDLVDKAIEQKAIIVFRCHCLYKESVGDMGEWPVQTDSRLFKKLVEYCVNKGCRFMTMPDLVQVCSGSKP